MDQDRDPAETREWLDALDSVEAFEGIGRVDELLDVVLPRPRHPARKSCRVSDPLRGWHLREGSGSRSNHLSA